MSLTPNSPDPPQDPPAEKAGFLPALLLMAGLGREAREALPDPEPPQSVGDRRKKEGGFVFTEKNTVRVSFFMPLLP